MPFGVFIIYVFVRVKSSKTYGALLGLITHIHFTHYFFTGLTLNFFNNLSASSNAAFLQNQEISTLIFARLLKSTKHDHRSRNLICELSMSLLLRFPGPELANAVL
jgi:hypothetical protein